MEGNVVLCGFMGSGKTNVGRRVAKLLNREFCDLDAYIQCREGMSVSEIFAAYGEEGFREREAAAVREVAGKKNMIIASGGGTVLFQKNVDGFHEAGCRIYFLEVPLAALQERLKRDKQRPLLQRPDRRRVIAELFEKRCPLYRAAADVTIDAGAPPCVVARRVAEKIQTEDSLL